MSRKTKQISATFVVLATAFGVLLYCCRLSPSDEYRSTPKAVASTTNVALICLVFRLI